MWLSSNEPGDSSKEQESEKIHFRSNSPPLEGGESLCEFYVEHRDNERMNKSLQISPSSESFQDALPNVHTNIQQNDVFHFLGEEKFPSKNFISLFNKELFCTNSFTQTFLQSILSSVDSTDPVVANAWMETLLDVIDLLPKEIIKSEILTLAVNKGQLSQPVSSRLLCCKMLGKICIKFDPYIIMKEVLPVVLSLCQDVDFEVRGFMCRQLDVIAKGIGLEATKSAILPELVELASDEEVFVRLAAIETVIQMLSLLDDDTCKHTIIPLVKKFCENSLYSKDSTLPVVSKQLGQLCHGLALNFTTEQKQWFLQFFKDLSQLGLSHQEKKDLNHYNPMPDLLPEVDNKDRFRECRHACAFNFPAMVLFVGPENFEEELHNTFRELCADPFRCVRQTMASGFFEVARLLNTKAYILHPEMVLLLKDESVDVLKKLIPCLPESLKSICSRLESKVDEKDDPEVKLVRALITCEEATSVSSSWRLHADFLSCLSCLPFCISSETIFTKFVPLLFVKLHTARPIPCRTAAAYSLLVFLRSTPSLERRKGIINELIRELCFGKSCHKRMLFIKVCEIVIELFSKVFFKNHFFKPLLQLSADPVPNIRLCLCKILPKLKSLIKLPRDSHLLQELEACVKTLMNHEKDRDVVSAVSKAIQELDKIEVTMESLSRRSSACEFVLDLDDRHKENEETHLLIMEFNSQFLEKNRISRNTALLNGNSTVKSGKIPVRKCGTLPKPSKTVDVPYVAAEKVTSTGLQKSIKNIKRERRISTPIFSSDVQKSISKSIQTSRGNISNPVSNVLKNNPSKCSIPVSKSAINTWPRQKPVSSIPKQTAEHCLSPLPLPQHFLNHKKGDRGSKLGTISGELSKEVIKDESVCQLAKENVNKAIVLSKQTAEHCLSPLPLPQHFLNHNKGDRGSKLGTLSGELSKEVMKDESVSQLAKENVNKAIVLSPCHKKQTEVTRRVRCIPSPSPETLRKSATFSNLNFESKIPTSSPKRRSLIKD